MTAKKTPARKAGAPRASSPAAAAASESLLVVCIQDPFGATGCSSRLAQAGVQAADGNPRHQWRLTAVLEVNPPRFFAGWATTGGFTLDVSAAGSVAAGAWGGAEHTVTAAGACRVLILPEGSGKVRFALASGAARAPEKGLPRPDTGRFLNADVGFELNGAAGITAAACAVVSGKPWSQLVAGSNAPTKGLAFDGRWRSKLGERDGDALATAAWAFAVMSRDAYRAFCARQRLAERIA